jgi:Zn-dependent protease with chaperone function
MLALSRYREFSAAARRSSRDASRRRLQPLIIPLRAPGALQTFFSNTPPIEQRIVHCKQLKAALQHVS